MPMSKRQIDRRAANDTLKGRILRVMPVGRIMREPEIAAAVIERPAAVRVTIKKLMTEGRLTAVRVRVPNSRRYVAGYARAIREGFL